jgi:hypothetical protein
LHRTAELKVLVTIPSGLCDNSLHRKPITPEAYQMNRQKIFSRKFKDITLKFLLSFCLLFYVSVFQTANGQTSTDISALEINNPLTREISGEAKHGYQLTLSANQHAKIIVEQQGIDISVRLSGSDGKTLANFDSEMRTNGSETVEWAAKTEGVYQLDVAPRYKFSDGGKYKIELKELRSATPKDSALDEARGLYAESIKQFSAGDYEKAKSLIEQTIEIYQRESGLENPQTALALTHLARVTDGLGKYDEAEKINQKVLTVREKILGVDHPDLGYTFNYLALNNSHRGDFQKAIDYHKRALGIREKNFGSNHPIVAVSIINLGVVYDALGDKLKAGEL